MTVRALVAWTAACLVCACGSGDTGVRISSGEFIELSADGTFLYASTLHGQISRIDTVSGTETPFGPRTPDTFRPSIAVGAQYVFTATTAGEVQALPKSGGAPVVVASAEQQPISGIGFDGARLYWVAGSPPAVRTLDPGSSSARTASTLAVSSFAAGFSEAVWVDEQRSLLHSSDGATAIVLLGPIGLPTGTSAVPIAITPGRVWIGNGNHLERTSISTGLTEVLASVGSLITGITGSADGVVLSTARTEYVKLTARPALRLDTLLSAGPRSPESATPVPYTDVYRIPATGGTPVLVHSIRYNSVYAVALVGQVAYWAETSGLYREEH